MAKILTDMELGEIVWRATHDTDVLDDSDSYLHFLEDLVTLVCDHFGGEPGTITPANDDYDDDIGWTVAIRCNECVPSNGGVFKDYDTDVTWKDGEEL